MWEFFCWCHKHKLLVLRLIHPLKPKGLFRICKSWFAITNRRSQPISPHAGGLWVWFSPRSVSFQSLTPFQFPDSSLPSKFLIESEGQGRPLALEMITRSKLVEQLRDYQIRSQHKYSALTVFSPKPHLNTRVDVAVAIVFTLLFCILSALACATLYFRRLWIFLVVVCLSILLFIRLKVSRQSLARKRERRLPLSI